MKAVALRLLLAFWFAGVIGISAWGDMARGQTPSLLSGFLPLIARDVPFLANPAIEDYLGLLLVSAGDVPFGLYSVRADGSDLRLLTSAQYWLGGVTWSPDSRKIAFLTTPELSGRKEAMVMNGDGSGLRPLLAVPQEGSIYELEWSPRGDYLLAKIEYMHPELRYSLLLVAPDGSVELITEKRWFSEWSPDGRYIFYVEWMEPATAGRLFVYSMADRTRVHIGDVASGNPVVMWTPDASKLLYVAQDGSGQFVARLVNPDGSDPRDVYTGYYRPVAWLRRGEHLLLDAMTLNDRLYTVSATGGEVLPLTSEDVWFGGVSPDGGSVLYATRADGKVWLHPIGGVAQQLATLTCPPGTTDCSLGNETAWSRDGDTVIYKVHESSYRLGRTSVWVDYLGGSTTSSERLTGFISVDHIRYLPASPSLVGMDLSGLYPSYPVNSYVADSDRLDIWQPPFPDGQSHRVTEWRYLPK